MKTFNINEYKVLVACECSGRVRDAFIKRGISAISCDLQETEVPGPHYRGSVFDILYSGFELMVAHPPCTDICVSGAKHFYRKRDKQKAALEFVRLLWTAPINHIALENPVGIISTHFNMPPSQIIQPWQFGHQAQKSTCLWIKNLPLLQSTKIVERGEFVTFKSGKRHPEWYASAFKLTSAERAKLRSRTFEGIADAMADQWGAVLGNFANSSQQAQHESAYQVIMEF